jgi:hypothetical protein
LEGSSLFFFIVALLVFIKSIQRAFKFGETLRYEMKIYGGGFYGGMSQESFDGIKIGSLI